MWCGIRISTKSYLDSIYTITNIKVTDFLSIYNENINKRCFGIELWHLGKKESAVIIILLKIDIMPILKRENWDGHYLCSIEQILVWH